MKNIFVFFLIYIVVICSSFGQCNKKQISNKMKTACQDWFQIDLQDHLKNDTITIYVNGCLILENEVLRSNLSTGYAGIDIVLTNNTRSVLIKRASASFFDCPYWPDVFYGYPPDSIIIDLPCLIVWKSTVRISVILNGNEENFDVDLSKGIYIGIGRRGRRLPLWLEQSKAPFIYD